MMSTTPFIVDVADQRIVHGQRVALARLYESGIVNPGIVFCGQGTEHPNIDWHFASQFVSMHAPHPAQELKPRPGSPTWLVGPKIFNIVRYDKVAPWRYAFAIQLLVRLVKSTQGAKAQ